MILALLVGAALGAPPDRAPPIVPPPAPPAPPTAWVGALANDVPVWLVERHGLPLVRAELSFEVSALRATLPAGALDALATVWGEGTAAQDTVTWRASLERLGAAASVGCDTERCVAALEAPSEAFAEAASQLGALVRAPALPAGALRRWRREARLEWRTDWLGPGIVHARALGRLSWPDGHPLREDRAADTFDVSLIHVRRAWRAVVTQAPTRLVVVGDVSPSTALPVLEAAFGTVGHAAPTGVVTLPPPGLPAERHVFVDVPGGNQALVTVAWSSPRAADPDAPAYGLAFRALAEGFASRLNLRLREGEGLTYRVDGVYQPALGRSEVELAVDPERLPAALASLAAELDTGRAGFTEAEVETGRRQAWAEAALGSSTLAGVARALWEDGRWGRKPGDTSAGLAMLRDVSLAQVDAAAARWLAAPRLWLVSGDGDTLESALDEAGWEIDTRWGACFAVYGGRCP